jgi:hypothetical protein
VLAVEDSLQEKKKAQSAIQAMIMKLQILHYERGL